MLENKYVGGSEMKRFRMRLARWFFIVADGFLANDFSRRQL